jgi:hypothetical protein
MYVKRTHAGPVGVDLLLLLVGAVEVQLAILQAEVGNAVGVALASGLLLILGKTQLEAAQGGAESGEVDVTARAERNEVEDLLVAGLGLLRRGGESEAAEEGSCEESLELHVDGLRCGC